MKKIICLYGGPGSGKSTVCAGLYYYLKLNGFSCEMNREYCKDFAYSKTIIEQGDQTYIFAKQSKKERLYIRKGLDFIITDSPLLLTHFYGMRYDGFEQKYNTSLTMLKNHHGFCKDNGYKTDHFFLNRVKKYDPNGRYQTEEESRQIDHDMRDLLSEMNIDYTEVDGNKDAVENILKEILQ